eukprot:INCI4654.6.p1 GENE.INCI4654.6~~INCI4654.6.p1  ORF type:complete len:128 (+),score=9.38 INCI4654.6:308-691(+)
MATPSRQSITHLLGTHQEVAWPAVVARGSRNDTALFLKSLPTGCDNPVPPGRNGLRQPANTNESQFSCVHAPGWNWSTLLLREAQTSQQNSVEARNGAPQTEGRRYIAFPGGRTQLARRSLVSRHCE